MITCKSFKFILSGLVASAFMFNSGVSNASLYNLSMADGTSGHVAMGNIPHYPSLWTGVYSYGTDYLITYLKFDLSSIANNENITNITLAGTANSFQGDSIINAYHVTDNTLGGNSYSSYTYNAFHAFDTLLGTENQAGTGLYSWNISGFNYATDLVNNVLTIALTSDARADAWHWVNFNRDFTLNIQTVAVSSPATALLFGTGLLCIAGIRRKASSIMPRYLDA